VSTLELDMTLGELSALCHPTVSSTGKVTEPTLTGEQLELAKAVYLLGLDILKQSEVK